MPLSWNPSSGFLLEPLTSCRGQAAVACVNVCLGCRDPCTSGGGGPAGCSAHGAGPEMLPPPEAGAGWGGVQVTSSQLRQPPWAGSWGCSIQCWTAMSRGYNPTMVTTDPPAMRPEFGVQGAHIVVDQMSKTNTILTHVDC